MHLNDFNLDNESFDITNELKVSEIINNNSDKVYTKKNDEDKYGYDLKCFNIENDEFLGFIEVEVSHHELLDGKTWKHSFLMRKILEFDNIRNIFTNKLKENYEKTVYIKFNNFLGLGDCICCDILTIRNFNETIQEKTKTVRQNKVFRTNKNDRRVAKGITDCIKYIEEYFICNKRLDNWM